MPYDPDQARQLIMDAGVEDADVRTDLRTLETNVWRENGNAYAAGLNSDGFDAALARARTATDTETRVGIYWELTEMLRVEGGQLPCLAPGGSALPVAHVADLLGNQGSPLALDHDRRRGNSGAAAPPRAACGCSG